MIVKPKMEAVSDGIRIVDNEDDLRDAVSTIINEFGQHVLIEECIAGRDSAIGLLCNGDPEVLPIVEIDLKGDPNAIQLYEPFQGDTSRVGEDATSEVGDALGTDRDEPELVPRRSVVRRIDSDRGRPAVAGSESTLPHRAGLVAVPAMS